MSVNCDRFGFFNGIYGIEQSNWANYWRGLIPDGIIAGQGNEMQVYAQSDGMKVHVKTGQALVDNHRAWITAEKAVDLADANPSNPRIDLIVLRAVYGNTGESVIEIDAKTGTPSSSPSAPGLTQVTGNIYEIPLAQVSVPAGAVTILAGNVSDRRYVYKMVMNTANWFSGTSVTPLNDREFRNNTAINSLTINLPQDPNETFITGVNFRASSSFSGVTFRRGSSSLSPKIIGDRVTLKSRKYNLIIWWDGAYYWVASKAVAV